MVRYGFSISWAAANLVIGLICGFTFNKFKPWFRYVIIIVSVAIGMIVVKTAIECLLYGIPVAVKVPKNLVAFAADSIVMLLSLGLFEIINKRTKLTHG